MSSMYLFSGLCLPPLEDSSAFVHNDFAPEKAVFQFREKVFQICVPLHKTTDPLLNADILGAKSAYYAPRNTIFLSW